jgi:hypothetical protein
LRVGAEPRILAGMKWIRLFICAAVSLAIVNQARSDDKEPTAFELIKMGNEYVGKEAKDRVVQIRSDKSVGTLTPNIWYVVYYDPDATAKAVEVKFAAGNKVAVKRPARVLEFFSGNREMEKTKLKIDSDKALATATKDPLLKNLTLHSTQMWLQIDRDYGIVWKVRLWAAKLRRPADSAEIGDIYISADEGKVVRNDLHPDKVD